GHPQSVAKATNPPQFDAVGAGTRLVTFTIGANDIGFPSFVLHCVTRPDPGVCKRRFVHGSRDDLRVAISLLGPKLSTAIGDLRRRAPDARIVVVGYPTIFPGDGSCPGVPVNPDDIRYLAGVLSDLDSTLAAAAKSSGVTFVDTARSSVGHDMCAGADRWVNPPGIDVPKVRDGLIAHPNSAGTRRIATLVTAAVEQELGR
ncbi:MAG: SGNH/GDSL hydrolase family protein, partial [Actinobacteria bacterium]|nr:SGNH/GDSL hydrolase family protein [Actinomycetota bacterium]